MGNIHSVTKSLESLGEEIILINKFNYSKNCNAIILQGVGAFDAAMQVLNNTGMSDALLEANNRKTPIFGICLGMQLLFNRSEEGNEDGLGLIDGEVKKIKQINDLKIPHMGWNETYFPKKTSNFKNIKNKSFFYYVHSYECVPSNENVITSYTYYGNKICSSIEYKNIFATQFHPEKSGNDGIKIYKNFIRNLI